MGGCEKLLKKYLIAPELLLLYLLKIIVKKFDRILGWFQLFSLINTRLIFTGSKFWSAGIDKSENGSCAYEPISSYSA